MKKYLYTALFLGCAFLLVPTFASAQGTTASLGARISYDLNTDGVINAEDMALVLGAWGPCIANTACAGDLNGDAQVNQTDIDIIKRNWTNKPIVKIATNKSADLDKDGSVGGADLSILLGAWGTCTGDCPADLNADGIVGKADQAILLAAWSSTQKPTFSDAEKARIRAAVNLRANTSSGISTSNTAPAATALETRERTARRDAVKGVLENVRRQLTNGISVLVNLTSRIDSRIEKLNAEGIDTSTSATFVASAKVEIEAARAGLAALPSTLEEASMTTESFAKVRASVAEIKKHLETGRKHLIDAISNLKPGINTEAKTSTSAQTN